jgi:aspartate/methionine/tyrosine aminotransferase
MLIRPFALERYFAEHEFTAELLLCSSDVEAYALRELLALADDETRGLWEGLSLGYTETAGHPLLRAEIAALYPGLEADDVLVFAGAEEAIFAFAHATLGGDDHAVVVTPDYQSLHEVARAAGAEVSTVELEHDSGWALDLDDVRGALRPDTRAIVVNFPHNPTGAHIDRGTLGGLVEIAEEADAHLFSD